MPVVAKSSGPIVAPSGLVPNASDATAAGGSAARSGCVDSTAAFVPRAPGARVTTRGLRQMTTGVTPGVGLRLVKVRKTVVVVAAAGVGAAVARPRPTRAPRP